MEAASHTVEVGKIEPGAVLAEAVTDRAGAVLLPAGSVLDAADIAALVRRGVSLVRVCSPDPAKLREQREVLSARLDFLFRHAGDSPVARSLYRSVLAYWSGKDKR